MHRGPRRTVLRLRGSCRPASARRDRWFGRGRPTDQEPAGVYLKIRKPATGAGKPAGNRGPIEWLSTTPPQRWQLRLKPQEPPRETGWSRWQDLFLPTPTLRIPPLSSDESWLRKGEAARLAAVSRFPRRFVSEPRDTVLLPDPARPIVR